MTELFAAIGTAAWLGILTSISPCPLASNVAAVSFVGRHVASPRRAFLAGTAYAAGRALTYVVIAVLVVSSVLSIPAVSLFLQKRMNQVLGPLLIVIGVFLLGWVRLRGGGWKLGPRLEEKMGRRGIAGAGVLGMIFALSFCPVSAGLFFGGLIPLAAGAGSRVLLPAVYGIGTGLPVLVFAVLIATGAHGVGRAFNALTAIDRAARPVTGAIFILAGIYLVVTHLFGLNLF